MDLGTGARGRASRYLLQLHWCRSIRLSCKCPQECGGSLNRAGELKHICFVCIKVLFSGFNNTAVGACCGRTYGAVINVKQRSAFVGLAIEGSEALGSATLRRGHQRGRDSDSIALERRA